VSSKNTLCKYTEYRVKEFKKRRSIMHFFSIILFALSSNIDCFAVGMAYGIKDIHISYRNTLLVSFITFIGTVLSMAFGKSLLYLIPIKIASLLGGSLIICMGLYYFLTFLWHHIKDIRQKNLEESNDTIDITLNIAEKKAIQKKKQQAILNQKELIVLGVALSINNMGLGVGASITGLNLLLTSFASFLCSFFLLYFGNEIGNGRMAHMVGKYAEPISGLIIILLGVLEIYI